jgi:hypothetical protein
VGAHPNPRPAGSTPPNGGICNENWVGLASKSCSVGWVCLVNFYLWGAHPNPRPAGSTPPNGGVCFENWAGASKQKLLLGVGLQSNTLFGGVHPTPGPTGATHSKRGNSFENWVGTSKQKLLLGVVLHSKTLFGGLTPPLGPQGPPTQKGVITLRIGWGPANKSCSSQWVYQVDNYFWGSHHTPGPTGSLQRGYLLLSNDPDIYKALLISPGLNDRLVSWLTQDRAQGQPNFFALGSLRSICTGLFHNEIVT